MDWLRRLLPPDRLQRCLASLMMVGLLLLPPLGAALDHHFPERQPDHEHIYLGRVTPSHFHDYQIPHSHHPPEEGGGGGAPAPRHKDVVYLTSYSARAQSLAMLDTVVAQEAPPFQTQEGEGLLVPAARTPPPLRALLAPPWKPPLTPVPF